MRTPHQCTTNSATTTWLTEHVRDVIRSTGDEFYMNGGLPKLEASLVLQELHTCVLFGVRAGASKEEGGSALAHLRDVQFTHGSIPRTSSPCGFKIPLE